MSRAAAVRPLTTPELRARCERLRVTLLHPGGALATEEELAAAWPGGAENPYRGHSGWIECYAQCKSFARREEKRAVKGSHLATLEATVTAAAAREPIAVSLSVGPRLVYPKSRWALAWLDALDAIVAPLADTAAQLADLADASADLLRGLPPLTMGMAWRTWAWILTHDDVGLPFADVGPIEPPAETQQLLAEDYLLIWEAHRLLHADAIFLMASSMPRNDGERSRLGLGGFLASYASEHGIAPSHIMRRWSLGESIAAATASAEAHRVGEANAKRKARGAK